MSRIGLDIMCIARVFYHLGIIILAEFIYFFHSIRIPSGNKVRTPNFRWNKLSVGPTTYPTRCRYMPNPAVKYDQSSLQRSRTLRHLFIVFQ